MEAVDSASLVVRLKVSIVTMQCCDNGSLSTTRDSNFIIIGLSVYSV